MKAFIRDITLFSFFFLATATGVDYYYSSVIVQVSDTSTETDEYSVWNDIYSKNIDAEVLIIGSSRAWVHVDPAIISSKLGSTCYNLGLDGNYFAMQKLRLEEYLRNNKIPELIVFSLDHNTFKRSTKYYAPEQILPFALLNNRLHKHRSMLSLSTTDLIFPGYRYRGKKDLTERTFSRFLRPKSFPKRESGYWNPNHEWNPNIEYAQALQPNEFIPDTILFHQFKSLIKQLQNDDIDILLMYTPEYEIGGNFLANRMTIQSTYDSLSMELSIPYKQYTELEMCRDTQYFYNVTHLNKKGATKFSSILAEDITKIIF